MIKIKYIINILMFVGCILSASAQDVQPRKVIHEKLIEERDTITLEEEIEEYRMEYISMDSVGIDSILPWPLFVTARLDTCIKTSPYLKGVNAGVMVYDFTDNKVLYAYREKDLFKPASNMKLFSGIAALDKLGPDHEFTTNLYYTGEIRIDTVYTFPDSLKTGIPLEEMVDSVGNLLYKLNKVLYGDIIGIGSYDPMFQGTHLNYFADKVKELNIDSIAGNFYSDDSQRYNNIISPLQVNKTAGFMNRLKEALQRRGIKCTGSIGSMKAPTDTVLIATHKNTLKQIMYRMMKQSDNQYAENVYQRVNSFFKPDNAVHLLVKKLGFIPSQYSFEDGSGLSHNNRVSAEIEVAFLKYAREKEYIYSTLYNTLPIAGVDGTLGSRMKDTSAYRNVRAKTGTINGVITLAGYCTAFNGHELIFAILLNDIKSQVTAKALEDELCTIMTHDSSFIPKKKVIIPKVRKRVVRKKVTRRRRK